MFWFVTEQKKWQEMKKMNRFCTRTKGLTEEQNKQYAKDLKEFSKQEAEKFRNQEQELNEENSEE